MEGMVRVLEGRIKEEMEREKQRENEMKIAAKRVAEKKAQWAVQSEEMRMFMMLKQEEEKARRIAEEEHARKVSQHRAEQRRAAEKLAKSAREMRVDGVEKAGQRARLAVERGRKAQQIFEESLRRGERRMRKERQQREREREGAFVRGRESLAGSSSSYSTAVKGSLGAYLTGAAPGKFGKQGPKAMTLPEIAAYLEKVHDARAPKNGGILTSKDLAGVLVGIGFDHSEQQCALLAADIVPGVGGEGDIKLDREEWTELGIQCVHVSKGGKPRILRSGMPTHHHVFVLLSRLHRNSFDLMHRTSCRSLYTLDFRPWCFPHTSGHRGGP